jgi:hypothetical protein
VQLLAPSPSQPERSDPFHGFWSLWEMLEFDSAKFANAICGSAEFTLLFGNYILDGTDFML